MISVSRVYACDSLLDGLRAPPLTGLPSPAAMANGAMQTASSNELAMIQTRRDMCRGLPVSVTLPSVSQLATAPRVAVGPRLCLLVDGASVVEARDRVVALGHEREQQVQARDLEGAADARVGVDDDELAAALAHALVREYERGQAGGVHVAGLGEIDDEPVAPLVDRAVERLAQLGRRVEVEVPADGDQVAIVVEHVLGEGEVVGHGRPLDAPTVALTRRALRRREE